MGVPDPDPVSDLFGDGSERRVTATPVPASPVAAMAPAAGAGLAPAPVVRPMPVRPMPVRPMSAKRKPGPAKLPLFSYSKQRFHITPAGSRFLDDVESVPLDADMKTCLTDGQVRSIMEVLAVLNDCETAVRSSFIETHLRGRSADPYNRHPEGASVARRSLPFILMTLERLGLIARL